MSYFAYKFVPHRRDFPDSMTEADAAAASEHAAYWQALVDKGTAIAVGSVDDPEGFWGFAMVEAADAAEVEAIRDADPIIRADVGSGHIYSMPAVILRS